MAKSLTYGRFDTLFFEAVFSPLKPPFQSMFTGLKYAKLKNALFEKLKKTFFVIYQVPPFSAKHPPFSPPFYPPQKPTNAAA